MAINGGFYPTIQNSLEAALTAGINDTVSTIPVDYCEYFVPRNWAYTDVSATNPVLAVIGYDSNDYTYPETVKITAVSAASGAGSLTVVRGVGGTATAGGARSWLTGDKIAVVLTSQHIYQIQNTLANIGYQQGIGVDWDTTSASPTLSYVDQWGNPISPIASDFANSPIYGQMKRCNLADDGTVNAWWGDVDFAYDGSNGQVMVWIPAFYYAAARVDNDEHIRWVLSPYYQTGFKRHPAFITDGRQIPGFYWGAFEGCAYDVSGSVYIADDGAGVDFTVGTGDKLSSVAGVKPISGANNLLTRANARILAENRGAGWQQIDFNQVSAIQLLFMVRYGTLNSQSIFKGVVDLPTGIGNESINTGYTAGVGVGSSDLGNASGEVSVIATQPFSFYGIENLHGNIWKWVDGINIKADNNPWIADHGYADDLFADPYIDTGLTLANANGYVKAIKFDSENNYFFLADDPTGSSSTYLCDYYYQSTGDRVAVFGGNWAYGALAGAFYWSLASSASDSGRSVGSRIAYVPQEGA